MLDKDSGGKLMAYCDNCDILMGFPPDVEIKAAQSEYIICPVCKTKHFITYELKYFILNGRYMPR